MFNEDTLEQMLITILSKWNSGHCKNNVSSPMTTVYYLFPYQ